MKVHTKILFSLLLFTIGVVLLFLGTNNVTAETITVDDDVGADYTKIQDAINNAEEGDMIRVWEGTYSENVVVDKSVSLVGNGSEVTTIDGDENDDVVRITADWVNMSGFGVTGSSTPSAGIHVESNHTNVSNNNCSDNYNGIYFYGSSDCSIENNTCSNNGHGIYFEDSSNCTIENNTCSDNDYYAIYQDSSDKNIISNNICSGNPRGIYVYFSDNNILTHNNCSHYTDHGIRLDRSSMNDILNNNCSNNGDGSGSDRGIYLSLSSNNNITNNICSNNSGNHGSGIYVSISHNNNITNNICSRKSNGILLSGSMRNSISGNTLRDNRRGIYLTRGIEEGAINNTAHFNTISGNSEYGVAVVNNNGYTINTTGNWWGDDSGPYHPTNNYQGTGDNVTIYVVFDPWIIKKANEKPTITITTPADNSEISGTVTISGGANDPDGTVHKVEISMDGGEWINVTGTTEWSYKWDSTVLENGDYIIRIRCYDGTGYSDVKEITVSVLNNDDDGSDNGENDDDKGFIPGFGAIAMVVAVGIALTLSFKSEREK